MYILQRDLTVPILQSDHMVPTRTYFSEAVTGRLIEIEIEKEWTNERGVRSDTLHIHIFIFRR
jgi:hypothetical protein